jgi:hypothetical protein
MIESFFLERCHKVLCLTSIRKQITDQIIGLLETVTLLVAVFATCHDKRWTRAATSVAIAWIVYDRLKSSR